MKCFNCNNPLTETIVNKSLPNKIVIEGLKAFECKKCGEYFFDEESYEIALKKLKSVRKTISRKTLAQIRMLVV